MRLYGMNKDNVSFNNYRKLAAGGVDTTRKNYAISQGPEKYTFQDIQTEIKNLYF
jgi:hypothetical protein